MPSSSSPEYLPSLPDGATVVASGSTWGERLLLNLLSYSLVLVPIAAVVLTTRYRFCPTPLQTSALLQWFVFGHTDASGSKTSRLSMRRDHEIEDNVKLLNETDTNRRAQDSDRSYNYKETYIKLIWCSFGLLFSYLIWGVLQEKIMTSEYEVSGTDGISDFIIKKPVTNGTKRHFNTSDQSGSDNLNQTTDSEKILITFHDSQFLVFINRIIAFILSIIALVINRPKRSQYYQRGGSIIYKPDRRNEVKKPPAPLYEYVYCSLSNILSSWCQYEALKYVNFPTQVLSKSCKLIAVMLMSKLMLKKRYLKLDYLCAFLLSIGMFVFLLNQPFNKGSTATPNLPESSGNSSGGLAARANETQPHIFGRLPELSHLKHHLQTSSLTSGLLILALYLIFDSFTSNWQQSLFDRYEISNWQMMAATNFYSIMLTLTSLHQLGLLEPNFRLLASSSVLLFDCLMMSIMSSIGQLFVYYTIKQFGPVVFTLIMTLRQLLAILLSCTIFGHPLTLGSISGLVIVFAVIGFQMWHKQRQRRPSKQLQTGFTRTSFGNKL